MGFPKVFCKRTKFKLNQREQRKTQNIAPCIIRLTSKKPVKISEEQIRWAMSEAITDDGKRQREYVADYYREYEENTQQIITPPQSGERCTLQEAAKLSLFC